MRGKNQSTEKVSSVYQQGRITTLYLQPQQPEPAQQVQPANQAQPTYSQSVQQLKGQKKAGKFQRGSSHMAPQSNAQYYQNRLMDLQKNIMDAYGNYLGQMETVAPELENLPQKQKKDFNDFLISHQNHLIEKSLKEYQKNINKAASQLAPKTNCCGICWYSKHEFNRFRSQYFVVNPRNSSLCLDVTGISGGTSNLFQTIQASTQCSWKWGLGIGCAALGCAAFACRRICPLCNTYDCCQCLIPSYCCCCCDKYEEEEEAS